MVVSAFIFLAASGLSSRQVDESAYLANFIRNVSAEVSQSIGDVKEPQQQIYELTWAANDLQGIDDVKAMDIYQQAWKIAIHSDDKRGQEDIALGISGIDPVKGKAMLPAIPDERVAEEYADAIFPRHPKMASKLYDKKQHYNYFQKVITQCDVNVRRGIGFLQMVDVDNDLDNREEVLENVVPNLSDEDAKTFLAAFHFDHLNRPDDYWQISHRNATAEELEKEAGVMPTPDSRVNLLLAAMAKYHTSNPARAGTIADAVCDEALSNKTQLAPIFPGQPPLEWKYKLLPEITFADTPKVRAYLESVDPHDPADDFASRVARSWSNIDLPKAALLFDAILQKNPRAKYGPHGQYISDDYRRYLVNLAKVNSTEAVKQIVTIELGGSGRGSSGQFRIAADIVQNLWQDFPDAARKFCAEPSPWIKSFGSPPSTYVDVLELDRKARQDPTNSLAALKQMKEKGADGLHITYVNSFFTTYAVVASMAHKNVDEAIQASKLAPDPMVQVDILGQAFDNCADVPFEQRRKLLDEAVSLIKTVDGKEARLSLLVGLADRVANSWQRLQPWPPATG